MDADRVWLRVHVPKQDFEFDYHKADWEAALKEGRLSDLIDWDISDIDVFMEYYGPDGERIYT